MVTTRRSSGGKRSSPLVSFEKRQHQWVLAAQSAGIQRLGQGTEECFNLVRSIFEKSIHGLWFQILPVDGHEDDICVGTGVEWQYLLPLLTKCGLLRSRVSSMVTDVHCDNGQWDEMAKSFLVDVKMEVTCICTWHSRRSYFYCMGKPLYRNVFEQEVAVGSGKLVAIPRVPSRSLMQAVKKAAGEVINSQLANHVQPNPPRPLDEQQIDCAVQSINNHINYAMALDLNRQLCLSRSNAENIVIHSRKQANERFRNVVLHTANMWGWRDPCLTFARHDEIAKAACRQVSYDLGYKAPLAHTRLPVWYGMVNAAITGCESTNCLSPSNSGRVTYVDALENNHPGYLRELFRYAERVIGTTATWQELAEIINQKSSAPGEERPTLSISRRQLSKWFQMQGGKEVSAIEKPLLTQEHKQRRIEWARRWFDVFSDPSAPVAFLDEKWFYTTNRRQQMKVLPTAANEIGIMTAYWAPHIRSRRHPAKVKFLGVVACPQLVNNFDGRVCLHRVSKTQILSRSSKNKRFSVDQDVVQAIVSGEWKEQLATDGMPIDELLDDIKSQFDLDAYVSNRLVIGFDTYEGGVKKWKALEADNVISELGMRTTIENARVPVELKELELFVQQSAGDEVEEDVSCDSDFMMRIMPQVGMALRTAYHWLGRDETIYLVMDNAGGARIP